MDLDFECTRCGACCQDLRLPLSVDEAISWVIAGHEVQVLCEAIPWPGDPPPGDRQAENKRRRSFATFSGSMPVRVIVTLAATFRGGCPNLMDDLRCRIYDSRPIVCRIYPAEINPFFVVQPTAKECPPDAWAADKPPFVRGGRLVDDVTRALIDRFRVASENDVGVKRRLCATLGLHAAALSNEGYVVHAPGREALACALGEADIGRTGGDPEIPPWLFVSDRPPTVEALMEIGAQAISADETGPSCFEYVRLNPAR